MSETVSEPILARFTAWMFRWRTPLIVAFAALTAVMAYFAAHLRVDASFEKTLPLRHPYIQTFTKYQASFGGANRILVALMVDEGDIFTPEFFDELKRVTDEVTFLPSVDRSQVQSLFTPNVRYVEVIEDGFTGGNVIPSDFRPTPEGFARVRDNIVKSGKLGQLVANDFTGAIVSAQLLEVDPRTGARIDYARVSHALDAIRRRVESNYPETRSGSPSGAKAAAMGEPSSRPLPRIHVRIIGFAKIIGDVTDGARGVLSLFGISVGVTALLVWNYAGRWKLAAAPIVASLVAVVWQLGMLTALGYGIDPFSILVPFLVFAIGVSHGVQKICTFRNEMFKGQDGPHAARAAFMQLIVPGIVALCTDVVGFATMLVIKIESIRQLAIAASLGVSVIVLTNFFLLPLLLSYLRLPASYAAWVARRRAFGDRVCEWLARKLQPAPSLIVIAVALGLGMWGWWKAEDVRIGDSQAGVPELRPDSRYNRDSAAITQKFSIGVDVLSVIVETAPNGCVDYDVVSAMDRFEGALLGVPGVQSVLSLTTMAKRINAGYCEGALKWRVLPRNPQALAQAVSPIETSTGLLNADASAMPIMIFLRDHRAETLRAVTDAVKRFNAEHPTSKANFRLASGNAGVMAATNEVVATAEKPILFWVFRAVTVLCLVTFRSVRAALCIVLPLAIVSFLAYAVMAYAGIGLKTSTLPMVALGVGIGVDYGIYIFARLQASLRAGEYFEDAAIRAGKDAGAAVVFTGLTLAIGVSTWMFSGLKFQSDMGLLLTFMFLVNLIGAGIFMPAIARWLWRHHKSGQSPTRAPGHPRT